MASSRIQPISFRAVMAALAGVVGLAPAALALDTGRPGPIRVNQLGYLADGPKRATLVSDAEQPVEWRLVDADGKDIAAGKSQPLGLDRASGLKVHAIDFSGVSVEGKNYRLDIGGEESFPFAIADNLYGALRTDAMSYFYPVRSGVEIDGGIVGEGYSRPAGHAGVPPNKGDTEVPCLDMATARKIFGEPITCDYRLDVSGGWYDAGDFGKYVVNGGIAVAQLMGAYERSLNAEAADAETTGDGLLRIPEARNGLPDILDEARWELDFLISMMVPDGEPLAGMVHHKVHGENWLPGPMRPDRDPEQRVLYPPSTAATLNLAAVAAQGARLFAPYDADYAEGLLQVAKRAYAAAVTHPDMIAPYSDGQNGGGDYHDPEVSDEFYWAAAELYLTTGDLEWYDRLTASPHWRGRVFSSDGINWRETAGWARLQLASVPSNLSKPDLDWIRGSVRAAAETFLAVQRGEGFGLMYRPKGGYGWGSNHSVIENMIVAAAAYDVSGKTEYLSGVREGMDYILGRNAMGMSYVTGYGTYYAHRQFALMFANSVDPSLPGPPKGALAGGPNGQPADPVAEEKLRGCAPQACYIDEWGSYSTNEIAINWNAALSWIAAFLADTEKRPATSN
ncbi:MAG: endoglucanase [Rhizobiales bacterium]|nr:endoglucanase [Hyphomicrobiales bacterium]MBA69284.1 endoglucanase [Hyphomicrobiales bacterium]